MGGTNSSGNMNGKKNGGSSGLLIFLSVVLAVETVVAGFKYPGFFVKGKKNSYVYNYSGNDASGKTGSSGDFTGGSSDNSSNSENCSFGMDYIPGDIAAANEEVEEARESLSVEEVRELSPGNPFGIGIRISREEIESVEPQTATVSVDDPSCNVGGIDVDMKWWNLDGDDTVEMRTLGERYDTGAECSLDLYDFSLESGKDKFPTAVDITLPRPQGGNANGVVWYNPDTDIWEPTSYDISEDGQNYILHTDHFSLFGVEASDWITPEMLTADISRGLFCTGITRERFDDISIAELYNTPLVVSDERISAFAQHGFDNLDFVKKILAEGNLHPEVMYNGMTGEILGEINDTSSNIYSYTFDIHAKLNFAKEPGWSQAWGKVFTTASIVSFLAKLTYYSGLKDQKISSVLNEYRWDLGGIAVGLALSFVLPEVGVVAAAVTVGSSILLSYGPDIEEMFTKDTSIEAGVFRYYLDRARDESRGLVNYKGDKLYLKGGGWADEIRHIADEMRTEPFAEGQKVRNLDKAIDNRIDQYFDNFWNLSQDEKQIWLEEYCKDIYKGNNAAVGRRIAKRGWKDPDAKRIEEIRENVKKEFYGHNREMIYSVYKALYNEILTNYKTEISNTTLVCLNSTLTFIASDSTLGEGQTFGSDSIYSKEMIDIMFKDMPEKPNFCPADMLLFDYDPEYFHPYTVEGEDEIFSCRFYYYMMYGCPGQMIFAGNEDFGLDEMSPEIPAPEVVMGDTEIIIPVSGRVTKTPELKNEHFSGTYKFYDYWLPTVESQTFTANVVVSPNYDVTIQFPAYNFSQEPDYQNSYTTYSNDGFTIKAKAKPDAAEYFEQREEWICTADMTGTKVSSFQKNYHQGEFDYSSTMEVEFGGCEITVEDYNYRPEIKIVMFRPNGNRYPTVWLEKN